MTMALLVKLQMAMQQEGEVGGEEGQEGEEEVDGKEGEVEVDGECINILMQLAATASYCITSCPGQCLRPKLATFKTEVKRHNSGRLFWAFYCRLSGFISECNA